MARVIETSEGSIAPDRLRPLRYAWRVPQLLLHAIVAVPLSLLALNPLAARVRSGMRSKAWSRLTTDTRRSGFRPRRSASQAGALRACQ